MSANTHDPYAALRVATYRDYMTGSFLSSIGRQAVSVAVTWEIYQWTKSATALGLVGLINVIPLLVLSLPAGSIADRYDRRRIIARGAGLGALLSVALATLSYFHAAVPDLAPLRWANGWIRELALVFERHTDPGTLNFDQPALPVMFLLLLVMAIYADQVLHVGPIGLGWLRAAPSIGAFGMAMWLAHRAPLTQPGRTLLWSVVGFGLAIVIFGFSPWYWLSFIALLFTGVFDNVSVVVRQSLVQLLTPDHLRGRVTSVNQIFVGSSNEIGSLRAGLMAALFGPVAAVVWGGLGTLAVVGVVAAALPALRRLAPLHTLRPDE